MRSPLRALRQCTLALLLTGTFFTQHASAQVDHTAPPEPNTFTLLDSRTDQPIPGFDPIPENAVLNLNQLPMHLNIRANVDGEFGSLKFGFRDKDKFHIENVAPYAMFGDVNGDYNDGRIPIGSYTLVATPYEKSKARGHEGDPFSVSFVVVREGASLEVTSFILVDAETNEDLFPIEDRTKLDLSILPPHLNIRAEVAGPSMSLEWTLTPKQRRQEEYTHVESVQPYALFGDLEGDYFSGTLEQGEYLLSAVAFRQHHAKGTKGTPYAVRINIVNGEEQTPDWYQQEETGAPSIDRQPEQGHEAGLDTAYPNPFNPTTTIRFSLAESTHARLVVYDMLGRQVKTLVDGVHNAGSYQVVFEAGDLPSGAYLYRLTTPSHSFVRKITLSK